MFLTALTTIKEAKYRLQQINRTAKRKRYRQNAKQRMSSFVEMFPKLKRMTRDFSDVFQPSTSITYLWCTLTMCGALLMFQIEMVKCFPGLLRFELWIIH